MWDRQRLPYLADVAWPAGGPLLLTVQSRDQRQLAVLAADPGDGSTETWFEDEDDAVGRAGAGNAGGCWATGASSAAPTAAAPAGCWWATTS